MISNSLLKDKVLEKYIFEHCLNSNNCDKVTIEHPNYKKEIDVPNNWQLVQIGKSGLEFTNGNYSSKYPRAEEFVESGVPFIRANNIKDLSIVGSSMYYITPEKHEFLSKGHLKTNDIIIAIRGSIGLCAIVPPEYNDSNLNAQLTVLRCNDRIVPKFLLYQIASKFVQQQFGCYITGAALKQLSEKNMQKCYILIPPVNEQIEIVKKIEESFDLLNRREQNDIQKIKLKDILKEKILDSAICGTLVESNNKENWKQLVFSDVIDVRDGTHDSPKYVDYSDYPLITSKNLTSKGLNFSNVNYLTEQDYNEINKRSYVDDGDVLFAMIGSIGNPVIVKKDRPFAIKNVALFKCGKEIYNKFLYYFLLHEKDMNEMTKGGVQKFVSLKILRNYPIFLPPLEEQKRIVEKIESLFELIEQL